MRSMIGVGSEHNRNAAPTRLATLATLPLAGEG